MAKVRKSAKIIPGAKPASVTQTKVQSKEAPVKAEPSAKAPPSQASAQAQHAGSASQPQQADTSPKAEPRSEASPVPSNPAPSADQIARRAYELFLSRGGIGGREMEDWLQAERELRIGARR